MDDLDVRILKEFGSPSSPQWDVRISYSSIARKLGVDEETVRRRMKRAEAAGAFPGWKMMPNPRLIGCEAASLDVEVGERGNKTVAVNAIRVLDGVIKILDFRGRGIQLTLYHRDDDTLKDTVEKISSVCNSPGPVVWKLRYPQPEMRMTATDWQIVRAMLDDARASLEVVSKAVGVTTRTVERRLTLMSEGRAVYLQGTPVFGKHAGVSCVFLVHCSDENKKKSVDETILSGARRVDLSNTSSEQYSTFVMVYDNLSEADEVMDWIKELDGVSDVKMGIMKELIVVPDWLEAEIGKHLSAQ